MRFGVALSKLFFYSMNVLAAIGELPLKYQVRCAGLPLAVYREVAAHLGQIDGIEIGLVPQQSNQFDYSLSQIDSLWVEYSDHADPNCHAQVQQILAYYSDRYGAWETVEPSPV